MTTHVRFALNGEGTLDESGNVITGADYAIDADFPGLVVEEIPAPFQPGDVVHKAGAFVLLGEQGYRYLSTGSMPRLYKTDENEFAYNAGVHGREDFSPSKGWHKIDAA